MSQIVNYDDVMLEKRSIFLRLLERLIRETNYTAAIDLSDLVLKNMKAVDKGKTDLSLGKDKIGLKGVTAAGSRTKKDPKIVAMQAVIDRLSDLFGDEDLADDNIHR